MTDTGLHFVFGGSDVPEDEFNGQFWFSGRLYTYNPLDWYDNEHAPARLTVPGIKNALRYKALDNQPPAHIAMYDAASPLIFQSDEYRTLSLHASQRERDLILKLEMLNRRIYELHMVTSKNNNEELNTPAVFMQVFTAFVDAQPEVDLEGIQNKLLWSLDGYEPEATSSFLSSS